MRAQDSLSGVVDGGAAADAATTPPGFELVDNFLLTETSAAGALAVPCDASSAPVESPRPPAVHHLTISEGSIARGLAVREAFEAAVDGADVAERLLEEFASAEVPIVRQLQDVEAALVALLGRTITDPALAIRVAATLKETVAVSAAVRRRTEGSLQAAASLRAQRLFLTAQRRQRGSRGE